jgi:Mlc titration factor MtfA (ptsG expression regulator)
VLDMAGGQANGVPLLPSDVTRDEWLTTLQDEYQRFVVQVDAAEATDAETTLDPYAAQAEEEFFAVASEAFFVDPQALRRDHPVLYALFTRFYRQDPAEETAPRRA